MNLLTDLKTFIALLISEIICIVVFFIIKKNIKKSQLRTAFLFLTASMIICCTGLNLQILFSNPLNISPIYFDYFVYIGNCMLPISFLFIGLIFYYSKITLSAKYYLLFVIPVIALLFLWTNDYHHLFYTNYSIDLTVNQYGIVFQIWDIYTLSLFGIGIYFLLKQTFRASGFFSKQSILIVIGSLIPIVTNILTTTKIIPANIYMTPICFTVTVLLYAIAIFKFKFLSLAPIATQRIVNSMSDSFLVINEEGIITDFNDTFLKTFKLSEFNVRNMVFIDFVSSKNLEQIDDKFVKEILKKTKISDETILVKKDLRIKDKFFNIEASGIFSKKAFLGTLILLKDVTQHIHDKQTIQNNQNMLMERERLASLGQLIGGIAHNLKTPIMSIAGAAEGLTDLTTEYEKSVGDPEVTVEDHHEIAHDMKDWIEKIRSYTEYMSDVITAVKGQAVTMSEEQAVSFTLDELVKRVNILMRHELKNALVNLNIQMKAEPNTILKGNINSLVQVINNMISNAIQAYNGEAGKEINLILESSAKNVIISIQDFANGLPDSVKSKLFKEMITTKGKNGTGLGLFMSYSTIRAHFNGNVTFETETGKGTIFHISLPI